MRHGLWYAYSNFAFMKVVSVLGTSESIDTLSWSVLRDYSLVWSVWHDRCSLRIPTDLHPELSQWASGRYLRFTLLCGSLAAFWRIRTFGVCIAESLSSLLLKQMGTTQLLYTDSDAIRYDTFVSEQHHAAEVEAFFRGRRAEHCAGSPLQVAHPDCERAASAAQ